MAAIDVWSHKRLLLTLGRREGRGEGGTLLLRVYNQKIRHYIHSGAAFWTAKQAEIPILHIHSLCSLRHVTRTPAKGSLAFGCLKSAQGYSILLSQPCAVLVVCMVRRAAISLSSRDLPFCVGQKSQTLSAVHRLGGTIQCNTWDTIAVTTAVILVH